MIALGSGCVCCTVRGALVDALENLLRDLDNGRVARIGRVVIEAAATADPAAILAMIARHPYLSLRFHPDGVIAVVGEPLDALSAETLRQLAIADVVLLSGPSDDARQFAAMNPLAIVSDAASVPLDDLIGHDGFDPGLPALDAVKSAPAAIRTGEAGRIKAFVVERQRKLPAASVHQFLDYLAALQGANLLRVLGVVASDETEAVAVEGVGGVFYPPMVVDRPAGYAATRFVVIARDLDAATFAGYFDAFTNEARIDTPDRAALTANPLAIAGFSSRSGKS